MIVKYPFSGDVYSFAMVCYEILTGEVPYFEEKYQHEVKVLRGDCPKLCSQRPCNLKRLIGCCWSHDASIRPCFCEICEKLCCLKQLLLMTWKSFHAIRLFVHLFFCMA
ncbi:hypothetical protein M758_4G099100 [Ceratodon purpureus]|nr:hypothetical protein M758_4G099100 [Ceratodon purpureus]